MKLGWAIGHLTVDDIIRAVGEAHFGEIGGAVVYAAVGATIAGVRFGICSRLGSSYPIEALRKLEQSDLPLKLTPVDTHPRLVWILYERDGSRTILSHPEAGRHEDLAPRPEEGPGWNDISGIHIAALPIEFQRQWVIKARERDIPVSLDPLLDSCINEPEKVWQTLPLLTAFMPSEVEAEPLYGGNPVEAAKAFVKGGAGISVVKLGKEGSVIATGNKTFHVSAFKTHVVDPTGAGDSFCGAFLASILLNEPPLSACRRATVAASMVIECYGALSALEHADKDIFQSRIIQMEQDSSSIEEL